MLSSILEVSVRRRTVVVAVVAGLAVIGAASLRSLSIDAVPDITNNQVQINTLAPSLSPNEVEKQVTFPVETALAGIPGLEHTRSLSRNGFSQVTAVFTDSTDIYFARQQVNERLIEVRESLPADAEPHMGAISTGLGEIYMWTVGFDHPDGEGAMVVDGKPGWQSDGSYLTPERESLRGATAQAAYLRTVQDWIIRPQLKGLPGIAGIDAIGGFAKQYHVQPDPLKLMSFGITFDAIIHALERNNVSTGAGYVEHHGESYVVRAAGRLTHPEEIGAIVVGESHGAPIRIRDVASTTIGRELRTGAAGENGREVVVGTALMLIGANSREVSDLVDRKFPEIRRSLPPDVHAKTVLNRTRLVDTTIETVKTNLFEGAVLVVAVLLAMLGNLRAALICAAAIPLSMLITATCMVKARLSGNLMSLGALDFGLIVDGAVIIVENCIRRLGEAQHRLGRLLTLRERLGEVTSAAREMARPSAFGQAIIITVYLPILTLSGIEGKMFRPMAETVIIALVAAFALSLTFVPAMTAILVRGPVSERENAIVRGVKALYRPTLTTALRFRGLTVVMAAAGLLTAAGLFTRLGSEFVPTLDESDIAMHAMRVPSTSLTQSVAMQASVERALASLEEVAFVFSKTGTAEMASDPMPQNVSDTFIMLKPRDRWPDPRLPKAELIARMAETIELHAPGNALEFTQPIQMRFNELIAGVRSDVAVSVFGDEFESIGNAATAIARVLRGVPGAADVKVEQSEGLPAVSIDVDREAAGRLGLNVADVHDAVAIAIGGRTAGQIFEGDRRFDIVVRLDESLRTDVDEIRRIPVPLPRDADTTPDSEGDAHGNGDAARSIPLGTVASIEPSVGPNQISRENGKRRVVVQANVRGRDLGSFVAEAQSRIEGAVRLPPGSWLGWGGQFQNLVAARQRLAIVVPLCLLAILALLAVTFDSLRDAIIVFTGVPLALTGGIAALWLRDMPFSITAAVGFVALSGVAVLNGLVLVSMFRSLRGGGLDLSLAIVAGSLTRLRPVLMTALVASLGFVPMALATGPGAEVQRPLATVVIGGLISSTLLTLVVLPAIYSLCARRSAGPTDPAASPASPPA